MCWSLYSCVSRIGSIVFYVLVLVDYGTNEYLDHAAEIAVRMTLSLLLYMIITSKWGVLIARNLNLDD